MRKTLSFTITGLVLLLSLAAIQDFLFPKSLRLFIGFKDILPDFLVEIIYNKSWSNAVTSEVKNPKSSSSTEASRPTHKILDTGENYQGLHFFYEQLLKLNQKQIKKVRILHYGDSQLWGDLVASRVRLRLQEKFGDGGIGFVPILNEMMTKTAFHTNLTYMAQFAIHRLKPGAETVNPALGFYGEGFTSHYSSLSFRHRSDKPLRSIPSLEIIFHYSPHPDFPDYLPNQRPYQLQLDTSFDLAKSLVESVSLKSENPAEILRFEPSEFRYKKNLSTCAAIRIEGFQSANLNFSLETKESSQNNLAKTAFSTIVLETNGGISYTSIPRVGVKLIDFQFIDPIFLECELQLIQPDLILFQYGVNESEGLFEGNSDTAVKYEERLTNTLIRFRQILPKTSFMVVGPPERLKEKNGQLYPMPQIPTIIDIQRRVTQKLQVGYFDAYELFGGPGHMLSLYQKRMAISDYTHLTQSGGDYLGEGIFKELYNNFLDYGGFREKKIAREEFDKKTEANQPVVFNSKAYATFFILVTLISLLMLRFPALRIFFLLLVSYYFYATWKFWPVIIIFVSTLIDFYCGRVIFQLRQQGSPQSLTRAKGFLILSLFTNLGLLFFFKYTTFLAENIQKIAAGDSWLLQWTTQIISWEILLPAGISFYTFQTLSYTIDVYRGKFDRIPSFRDFAFYVTFFPQLVAGPIVRAHDFLSKLNEKIGLRHFVVTHKIFCHGVFLILTGLTKKITADYLAVNLVDRVFDQPGMYSTTETIFAICGYALQIYGDFSGYSDIAVGSAKILGYNLPINFRRPYHAVSMSDFWNRWHISLGSWLKDYVYISMGGNRHRVYFNLFVVMALCGLWHGAGFNFILWGIYNGIILVIERATGLNKENPSDKTVYLLRRTLTLILILFGWMIFRSQNFENFSTLMGNLFSANFIAPNLSFLVVILTLGLYLWHLLPRTFYIRLQYIFMQTSAPLKAAIFVLALQIFYHLSSINVKNFIYFQF